MYRWYLAQAVPLRQPDGGTSGWVGTWTDIDDRRRAEERHERDARLLANVRDCIIVTDATGIVTYWNDAATRTFGWTAEEMCGQPLLNRFPQEARSLVADLTRQIAEGHDWCGEFEDYHKDGSRIWIDARVARICNASGQLIGIMGTSHDITARKRAEAERDRITARLRLQIDRTPLRICCSIATSGSSIGMPRRNGCSAIPGTMEIQLDVNGTRVTATLVDRETSKDVVSLLPLTLAVADYNNTKKISNLPKQLSTKGAPAGIDPSVGDVASYAPKTNRIKPTLLLFRPQYAHRSAG